MVVADQLLRQTELGVVETEPHEMGS